MKQPADDKAIDGKICTGCGLFKPLENYHRTLRTRDGRIQKCKICKALYTQKHYMQNKAVKTAVNEEYRKKNWERIKAKTRERYDPDKHKARMAINNAVRTGKLYRNPCDECEESKVEFHHTEGYDKDNWFTGLWLCRKHHAELHRKLRTKELLLQSHKDTGGRW